MTTGYEDKPDPDDPKEIILHYEEVRIPGDAILLTLFLKTTETKRELGTLFIPGSPVQAKILRWLREILSDRTLTL